MASSGTATVLKSHHVVGFSPEGGTPVCCARNAQRGKDGGPRCSAFYGGHSITRQARSSKVAR